MPTLSLVDILLLAALAAALVMVLVLSSRAMGGATRRQRVALLALRAGVFLCVGLALLDPQWVRAHLGMRKPTVAILLDTSRSMSTADAPEDETRLAAGQELVDGARRSLGDGADMALWAFDEEAHAAEELSTLEADGAQTDIAGAIRGLSRHIDRERLAAVWLLTDGRDTGEREDEAVDAAALLGVPVNAVGFGSDARRRDVELSSVLAPTSMRTGERAYAVATIRAPGFDGEQIKVTLNGSDGRSQSADVTVGEGAGASARFTISPKQPGMESYSIAAAPLEGELTEVNNTRNFVVHVAPGDRTVLLVDRPRLELKFLRRALEGLAGVDTEIYLQNAPDGAFWLAGDRPKRASLPEAAALRQYDAIVIGDVPVKPLLGGQQSYGMGGYAETALAEVLPLRLGGTLDGYLPAAPQLRTGSGAEDHPLLPPASEGIGWSRLPLLEGANLTKGVTPLAEVLLEAATTTGRRVPVVATRRVGDGRTLCITSDSTYRWVFSEYATDTSARAHAALWQRAVRWLSASTNDRPLSIALDKTVCTVGERVRVIAMVLDEAFAPVADAQVSATITGPGEEETTVECQPVGEPGRYEGSFRPTAAGKYAVQVSAKRGDENLGSAGAELVAHIELSELRDVRLNRPLLERIAEVSGGTYYEPGDAAEAMAQPPPATAATEHRQLSVTRSWPYLLLVLLLCGLDWGLRRRWHVG